jgi:hypothetical protein
MGETAVALPADVITVSATLHWRRGPVT